MAKKKYANKTTIEYFLGKLREKFANKADTATSLESIEVEVPKKGEIKTINGALMPDADGNVQLTVASVRALDGSAGLPVASIEGETLILRLNNNTVNLINFTVNGEAYQAEEGMTWGEWVESDYNPVIDSHMGSKQYTQAAAGGMGTGGTYTSIHVMQNMTQGYVCLSDNINYLVGLDDTIEAIAYGLNFDVDGGK